MSFGGTGDLGPLEVAFIEIQANTESVERSIADLRRDLLAINAVTRTVSNRMTRDFGSASQLIKTEFRGLERDVTRQLLDISASMAVDLRAGAEAAGRIIQDVGGDFDRLSDSARRELLEINQNMATSFQSGVVRAGETIRGLEERFERLNQAITPDLAAINRNLALAFRTGTTIAETEVQGLSNEFRQLGATVATQTAFISSTIAAGFSAGANAAEESVGDIGDQFGQLASQTLRVTSLISELFRSASNSADRSLRTIGGPEAFAESVLSAELAARRIGNAFENAGLRARISIGGISLGITSLGAGLAVASGAAVALGTVATAQLERTQTAFEALLGSEQEAKEEFEELVQLAATTPFEIQGLADNEAKLLASAEAMGISREAILDTLTTIGDLATVLGQPIEAVDSVTRALGQIASRGRVMTEELIQLSEALPGFPVFDELARGLNVTTESLDEMLREGTVPAQESIQILIQQMSRFPGAAGAMADQAETLIGLFSTLKDTVRLTLVDAFEPFTDQLRVTLGDAQGILEDFIGSVSTPINDLASRFLTGFVSAMDALGPPLGRFLSSFEDVVDIIGPATGAFGTAAAELLGRLGPAMVAVAGFVEPLIDLFAEIANDSLPRTIDVFAEVVTALTPTISILSELTGFVLPILVTLLEAIPAPVLAAVVVMVEFNKAMATVTRVTALGQRGFQSFAAGISPVTAALAVATIGLGLYAQKQSEAAAEEREHEATLDQFARALRGAETATAGIREEISRLIDSGEDLRTAFEVFSDVDAADAINSFGLSAQQATELILEGRDAVRSFAEEADDGSNSSAVAGAALVNLSEDMQEAADRSIDAGLALGDFTERQVEAALESNTASDGVINYAAALNTLLVAEQREKSEAEAATLARREAAEAAEATAVATGILASEIENVLNGTGNLATDFATLAFSAEAAELSEEQLVGISQELGVTIGQLSGAMGLAKDSVEAFTEGVASSFPSAIEIIGELDEITFDGLLESFREAYEAAVDFEANVALLAAFPNVQLAAIQAGPEVAAALAQGFKDGKTESLAEMELLAQGTADTQTSMQLQAQAWGINMASEHLTAGQGATAGWQTGLQIREAAATEAEQARVNIRNAKEGLTSAGTFIGGGASTGFAAGVAPINSAASGAVAISIQRMQDADTFSGPYSVGQDVVNGFVAGMESLEYSAVDKAQQIALASETAMRNALQTGSPSKVFMRIGEDTVAGFTEGMDQGQSAASQSAASLGVAAESGISGVPNNVTSIDQSVGGAITINVNVTASPGLSDAEARRQGTVIANAVETALARRRVRTEARIAV